MKILCIKDVIMFLDDRKEFTKGKVYEMLDKNAATNNSGNCHMIYMDKGWFDEHFTYNLNEGVTMKVWELEEGKIYIIINTHELGMQEGTKYTKSNNELVLLNLGKWIPSCLKYNDVIAAEFEEVQLPMTFAEAWDFMKESPSNECINEAYKTATGYSYFFISSMGCLCKRTNDVAVTEFNIIKPFIDGKWYKA